MRFLLCLMCLLWAGISAAQMGNASKEVNVLDLPKQQQERSVAQPGNNQPVWSAVRAGAPSAVTSLPGRETHVLIQTEGQAWRTLRNNQIAVYSGWALVLVMLSIAAFYFWRGTIPVKAAPTGRTITRFTPIERMAHWTTAICFTILACSGLILGFGKSILLPIIGGTLFSWLAILAKTLHNVVGPVFCLSIIITFCVFVRDNFPKLVDFQWLAGFGGLVSGKHIPSEKFNAGEKVWFWMGLLILGVGVSVTGLILDFPNFDQTRATMQWANTWHFILAMIFMIAACGHIYMGTLGMAGAYKAMREGKVDESWAKEHHEIWYDEMKKKGAISDASPASQSSQSPSK